MDYIKSFNEVIFSEQEVQALVAEINDGKLPNTINSRIEHVCRLKNA